MDILRISHYLAWNFGKSLWLNPREFMDVIGKYYSPSRSKDFFEYTLQSSGRDEIFFFTCLKELQETWGDDILSVCIEEFWIPPEFQDVWNLIKKKWDQIADEKEELERLKDELKNINPGKTEAYIFHKCVKNILDLVFTPNLKNWKLEQSISRWLKKIDILYENSGIYWFFNWLNYLRKINCAFIPFECKNYVDDPENPEVDQLAMRLKDKIGKMWFLILNKIDDKNWLIDKIDEVSDDADRKYIMFLDKGDIINIIDYKLSDNEEGITDLLMNRFKEITISKEVSKKQKITKPRKKKTK